MPPLKTFPKRFRDNDANDIESQGSSAEGSSEDEYGGPKDLASSKKSPNWYKQRGSWKHMLKTRHRHSKGSNTLAERHASRRRCWRRLFIVFLILAFFGAVAAIIYVALVGALVKRLTPPTGSSGLQHIVDNWQEPDVNGAHTFQWRDDFSRDIVPKNCHSHNDYTRSVPLYEALAAGCVSVEADVWLTGDNELLVSHAWKSTKAERTLRSLYLDPLTNIFTSRNVSVASTEDRQIGVFDVDPNASVILLIDFKSDGHKTWPMIVEQLQPLREKGWLTYFDGQAVVQGPLTVVGTGNTPFDLVQQNNTDRFIFFDAPLDDVSNADYTAENSLYASVQFKKTVGRIWFNKLTSGQVDKLKEQIQAADGKGLRSRYWDTPAWPISLRSQVWMTLTENGVGMLNVDDLVSATRWNWNWCVIAGLNLCG